MLPKKKGDPRWLSRSRNIGDITVRAASIGLIPDYPGDPGPWKEQSVEMLELHGWIHNGVRHSYQDLYDLQELLESDVPISWAIAHFKVV